MRVCQSHIPSLIVGGMHSDSTFLVYHRLYSCRQRIVAAAAADATDTVVRSAFFFLPNGVIAVYLT